MSQGVILLVEDNPGDVRLTVEALKENHLVRTVKAARDGMDALAYLHRSGPYTGAPRPELVLLDLNLPRKDGLELLAEIKEDPQLRSIPVVILTTSENPDDIRKAYDLHANAYVAKPSRLEELFQAMKTVVDFWFGAASLPAGSRARAVAAGRFAD
jgi:CheY-like chemotaxis protein